MLRKNENDSPAVESELKKTQAKLETIKENLLESLTCPISGQLMLNPVLTICGHTFEKEFILNWLNSHNDCPNCRTKIDAKNLIPNIAIKNVIANLHHSFPETRSDTFFSESLCQKLFTNNKIKDIIQLFTDRPDKLNSAIAFGLPPLHLAISHNLPDLVDALIKTFAKKNDQNPPILNIDQLTPGGFTPLQYSIKMSKTSAQICNLLLAAGADVEMRTSSGETALFMAAADGHLEKVQLLLAHPEIDVEAERNDGKTAMQIAQEKGHAEVFALFTLPQTQWFLALHKLKKKNIDEAVKILANIFSEVSHHIFIERMLNILSGYPSVYPIICEKLLPLVIAKAIERNDSSTIEILYTAVPHKINELLVDGKTAFHLAIQSENTSIVKLLLRKFRASIAINAPIQTDDGLTPLSLAIIQNQAPNILALLLAETDSDTCDLVFASPHDITPLTCAALLGKSEHVEVLAQKLIADAKLGVKPKWNVNHESSGLYKGYTALLATIEFCDVKALKTLLLVEDIDTSAMNALHISPLIAAVKTNDENKVRVILSKLPETSIYRDYQSVIANTQNKQIIEMICTPNIKMQLIVSALEQNNLKRAVKLSRSLYKHSGPQVFEQFILNLQLSPSMTHSFFEILLPKIMKPLIQNDEYDFIIQIFSRAPKLINQSISHGKSILRLALDEHADKLIEMLFDNFKETIDVNLLCEADGHTPLYVASLDAHCSLATFENLLKHGASSAISSRKGETVIANLIKRKPEYLQTLIDVESQQCDVNIKHAKRQTAIKLAVQEDKIEHLKILLATPGLDLSPHNFLPIGMLTSAYASQSAHTFNCFVLFKAILDGHYQNKKFILDSIKSISHTNLQAVFLALSAQYIKVREQDFYKIDEFAYLQYLIDALRCPSASKLMVKPSLEIWERFFEIADFNADYNTGAWAQKIQEIGFTHFKQSVHIFFPDDALKVMKAAAEKPVVSKNLGWLSFFRTTEAIALEELIQKEKVRVEKKRSLVN